MGKPDIKNINISFYPVFNYKVTLQQLLCGNNIRIEGLNIILDDLASLYRWILIDGQI